MVRSSISLVGQFALAVAARHDTTGLGGVVDPGPPSWPVPAVSL